MFERLVAKRCKYFAVMDFTLGFHQIGLNLITAYLTAFITFMGIYELTWVLKTLQAGTKIIPFAGIIFEICVDDCIVYGETQTKFS